MAWLYTRLALEKHMRLEDSQSANSCKDFALKYYWVVETIEVGFNSVA